MKLSFGADQLPLLASRLSSMIVFLGLIVSTPALSLAGSQTIGPQEHALIAKAQEALQKGRPGKANSLLTDYLQHNTKNASWALYLVLGNVQYSKQNMIAARKFYGRGLGRSAEQPVLQANYASACYALKRYAEAGRHFLKAFQLQDKPEFELLYSSGAAYFQAESYAESEAVLEDLLHRAKQVRTEWVELLTAVSMRQEKWTEAENRLRLLLERKPAKGQLWKLLAQVHLQQEAYQEAASALEMAYSIEPPSESRWKELADLYSFINAPLKAADTFEKAFGDPLEAEECRKIARHYVRGLRYDRAIGFLQRGIERDPSASLYLELGQVCYEAGRFQESIEAFDKALHQDSDLGEAQLWLGYAACQLRNWGLARQAFTQAARYPCLKETARQALSSVQAILQAREAVSRFRQANS